MNTFQHRVDSHSCKGQLKTLKSYRRWKDHLDRNLEFPRQTRHELVKWCRPCNEIASTSATLCTDNHLVRSLTIERHCPRVRISQIGLPRVHKRALWCLRLNILHVIMLSVHTCVILTRWLNKLIIYIYIYLFKIYPKLYQGGFTLLYVKGLNYPPLICLKYLWS